MKGPKLVFEGVGLTLGGSAILDGIDLTVAPGTVHALVGPNGGGKSSLVRALLGQVPHRGTVALDWPGAAPGVVAYVPQAMDFDRGLPITVEDFLAVLCQRRPAFLGPSKALRGRFLEALERIGMADRRTRRMGDLSGGERQRVLLAQALIPEPDLVVLDEPTTALDDAGVEIFRGLIDEFRATGRTVLWVEHDLAEVRTLADRVTGLNRKVLFDGAPLRELAPDRLLTLFAHPPRGLRVAS